MRSKPGLARCKGLPGYNIGTSAGNGTITGSGLRIDQAGSFTLKATVASGLTEGDSTSFSVSKGTPAISGVTNSQSIAYGTASVTLGGTVSATGGVYPANGETVTVTINGTPQNATISGGAGGFSVTYTTATIPASATPYTITYAYAGDANLNASPNNTSTALTVNKSGTSTALTSPVANPSVYGQSGVTFHAVVSATAPGSGTPSGTVQFQTNGVNFGGAVTLSGGSATSGALLTTLAPGSYSVTAVYNGDSNFSTNTSGTLTQTINKSGSSTTVTSPVANPSVLYGQSSVTFAATVSGTSPGSGTPDRHSSSSKPTERTLAAR